MKNDLSNYNDEYVVTKSFTDKEVLLHGTDPLKLLAQAKDQGIKDPVIFFITDKPLVFGGGLYAEHHSE